MKIDLAALSYKDKIELDDDINFDIAYLDGSPILDLQNVHVKGLINEDNLNNIVIRLDVKGTMFLADSVTLEKIPKDFAFVIDEIWEDEMQNKQNTLDIMELLWQNIVLEVPIRYTHSDAQNLKGDNWEVLSLDGKKDEIDPRLQKLYEYNKGGEDDGSSI